MTPTQRIKILFFIFFACSSSLLGAPVEVIPKEEPLFDFEHEDAYLDLTEALRSQQFVHRVILSTIVRDTAKVRLGSFYINQLLGLNAVFQPGDRGGRSFAKFASGLLAFGAGYAFTTGDCIELGFDVSAVSSIYAAYKYLIHSPDYTFWPVVGLGAGTEITSLRLSDLPLEAQLYQGARTMGFFTLGAIVPIVDVAIKAEARFNFYSLDRLVLSTGVGAVFFF